MLVPGDLDERSAPSVSANNGAGTESAIAHLYDLGHRDIGFVSLTATVPDHFERFQAYLAAMAARNLPIRPEWISIAHERNPGMFKNHLLNWLKRDHFPTALVSCDFMMTLALMGHLREVGLEIPRDVSVVTFDDPAVAAQMHPPLTAIAQPIPKLGYRAIEHLREMISGRGVPHVDRVETNLIVRESTAKPCR